MAKRGKDVDSIIGIGKSSEDKLIVQKSIPLLSLWQSDMTLAEFKILDIYLSRISSHEPEKRTVLFTKGELENLLGVQKINKADLASRLNSLGRFVEVEGSDRKIHEIALFEEAYGEMDENGLWTIKMTCTAKAMKYIFNIEELGYLRYKLKCITSLTSRYTYVLFMYLEFNRFRKSWIVGVDELRQILSCDTEPTYSQFKRFNDLILKRCQRELFERTECRFSYEPIKTGRRVTDVRFTLETLADDIEPSVPENIFIKKYVAEAESSVDSNAIYAEVLPEEFTPEEVEALRSMAAPVFYDAPEQFPPLPVECRVADYLEQKVAVMNAAASRNKINNKFAYLKTMIHKDLENRTI